MKLKKRYIYVKSLNPKLVSIDQPLNLLAFLFAWILKIHIAKWLNVFRSHRLGTSQNGSLFAICNPLICSLKPVKSGFLSDFFISKKNLYTQNGLYWVVLGSKLFLFSLNLFVKTYVFQLVRSSENVPDDKHLKVFKVANLFFEGKFILWPK